MSKLGNPAAVVLAKELANSSQGQKQLQNASNALKLILIVGGTVFASRLLYAQYKKHRAKKYLNENGHRTEVLAALMLHNAMFSNTVDILGFNFSFPDGTNEDVLNQMALQISDVNLVSKAYKIIFDRNLIFDIQSELSSPELIAFFNRINTSGSDDTTPPDELVPYYKGETVFVRNKNGVTTRKGEKQDNGAWRITNDSMGYFEYAESVGEIYDLVVYPNGEIDYIIDKGLFTFGYAVANHRDLLNYNPDE